MGRRRRDTPFVPDAVLDAEAVVAFYEKRLEEAYEKLGAAIEASKKGSPPAGGLEAGS